MNLLIYSKNLCDEYTNPYLTNGLMKQKIKYSRLEVPTSAISTVGTKDAITTFFELYEINKRQQVRMDSLLTYTLGSMKDSRVICGRYFKRYKHVSVKILQ